jgi:CHAT domain-containing protein/predicted negative regulator of RcsB-dependent stress response
MDRNAAAAEQKMEGAILWLQANPRRSSEAIAEYEKALQLLDGVADPALEVRVLHGLGDLYRDSGNAINARKYFSRGLEAASAAGLERERASLLRSMAVLELRQLRSEAMNEARWYCSEALQISRSNSDRNGVAEAFLILEDIYYRTSNLIEASEAATEAHTIWAEIGFRKGQARALWDLASIYFDRNDFTKAFDYGRQAQALFDSLHDELGRAKSSALLGLMHSTAGRKREALNLLEEAIPVLRKGGDSTSEAMALNSLSHIYAELGDYGSALPYAKLALENYAATGEQLGETYDLWAMGVYHFSMEDLAGAELYLKKALERAQAPEARNDRLGAVCWRDLGMMYQKKGDSGKAEESLNFALNLSRSQQSRDRRVEASVLVALGRLRAAAGQNAEALQLYRESLQLHQAIEDQSGQITALFHIASVLRQMNQPDASMAASERAIEIIEKMRTSLVGANLRTSYFASVRQHFDLYIDSLMYLRHAARALEFSERARGRTLLDSITETRISISETVDQTLAERLTSLRAVIDITSQKYTELLSSDPNSPQRVHLSDELRRLEAELDQTAGTLTLSNSKYADLEKSQPLTLSEIQQQVVGDDSLLLEYALGDSNSYVWGISRDGFVSRTLPKKSEIEQKVRNLRELITAPLSLPGETMASYQARVLRSRSEIPKAAAELTHILLDPVADILRNRRLVIIADGALQYLPFAVLPTPETAGTADPVPLIVRHEIVNAPSASTLAVIRKEVHPRIPTLTVAILADSVYNYNDVRCLQSPPCQSVMRPQAPFLPTDPVENRTRGNDNRRPELARLVASGREARAIEALVRADQRFEVTGFKANKAAALDHRVSESRIVHIAAHAILNDEHPDLSSLVLSQIDEHGNRQNGNLWLRDIYTMRLSAQLVVLSACETALGKEIKGEGLMSMVRGFMYSGTPRVVASLWKVDDVATAELMEEFYKQMLVGGKTAAAALREAQIQQLTKKSKQSPYYWAAFQLHGEWK